MNSFYFCAENRGIHAGFIECGGTLLKMLRTKNKRRPATSICNKGDVNDHGIGSHAGKVRSDRHREKPALVRALYPLGSIPNRPTTPGDYKGRAEAKITGKSVPRADDPD